jgi:biotin operon repressor
MMGGWRLRKYAPAYGRAQRKHGPRVCISCGVPVRWAPAECLDCRFGLMPRDCDDDIPPSQMRPDLECHPFAPTCYPNVVRDATPRTNRVRVDPALVRGLAELGLKQDEIGERLGCSQTTVWRILSGVRPDEAPNRRRFDKAEALKMLAAGMSCADIGRSLGVSRSRISHIKHGYYAHDVAEREDAGL